ncbi:MULTISPECIES: hypothetical protein [unclassified Neochlamydia]|uniref:hypothetical protein n=1 Tax=unclassified Neochlamydia TaxID=2643326 RepID=UPI00140BFB74|nr:MULTISPECIES: hypothetical protein [unclassified Neochlamydia]MBS4167299.1 Uncharacterized protein [Neochlamydia sp. AcF65]MBS4169713.1 Uncharacterized protein [Neochlamydia sp. AcF95]NGY95141.1 hypothetical protein [Neochlamydia sp. AcF84]
MKRCESNFQGLIIKLFICVVLAGLVLYTYIFKQNELTELRMAIPSLAKEVRTIHEENNRLKYEIDQFESPIHLMELMRMPEFSALKFAYNSQVIVLPLTSPVPGKDFADLQEENWP